MTDPENLVLEILRVLRTEIGDVKNELISLRNETREGLNRIDVRLGFVEQALASMLGVSASDRSELTALKRRIERIERRLELHNETTP